MKQRILIPLFALLLPAISWAQQTIYVKTAEAELRSRQGSGGSVVATVPQNTPLTVLQQQGLFYQVRTSNGAQGFISKVKVQDAPIRSSSGGLGGLVRDDRQITTMRSQSVNRGVAPQAQTLIDSGEIPESAAKDLSKTQELANEIVAADVQSFMAEGGL
ncbi:MAG: SH3 domain-containing protein [Sumerlaeia bacterium]